MTALMDPMLKWIGGATAAIVLALGTATVAGGLMDTGGESETVALEDAIPVDTALVSTATATGPEASPADPQPVAANDALVIKRILPIEGPMKYGEWHWDDEGVPEGPLVVTVDLEARVMSVFRGGYEIGAAVAMLGTDEHPTPLGTFPILHKQRHNVSEKYGNAPMPWSLFLTSDGIAIHGGSTVENGYASHGCIAIPDEIAAKLFEVARKGDRVIITRGKRIGVGDPIVS